MKIEIDILFWIYSVFMSQIFYVLLTFGGILEQSWDGWCAFTGAYLLFTIFYRSMRQLIIHIRGD